MVHPCFCWMHHSRCFPSFSQFPRPSSEGQTAPCCFAAERTTCPRAAALPDPHALTSGPLLSMHLLGCPDPVPHERKSKAAFLVRVQVSLMSFHRKEMKSVGQRGMKGSESVYLPEFILLFVFIIWCVLTVQPVIRF